MKCPGCDRNGRRVFGGYCSKAHKALAKKPKKIRLLCAGCGRAVTRNPSAVPKSQVVYCSRCPKHRGENHPNWKEGQYLNPKGYRLILIGGEYKLEHRHTWELNNLACLLPEAHGMIAIHHINMIKTDNRPENLVLLSSEEHGRIHRLIDAKRFADAKALLLRNLGQQAFFLLNRRHLQFYETKSLEEVLNGYQS